MYIFSDIFFHLFILVFQFYIIYLFLRVFVEQNLYILSLRCYLYQAMKKKIHQFFVNFLTISQFKATFITIKMIDSFLSHLIFFPFVYEIKINGFSGFSILSLRLLMVVSPQSFSSDLNFLIPIYLEPDGVNLKIKDKGINQK